MFPRKAQKKPRTCKHLLGRFNSVKKFRAFTASFLRRASGSADHSGADRTSDQSRGSAQHSLLLIATSSRSAAAGSLFRQLALAIKDLLIQM
jgi:hypothetical protein